MASLLQILAGAIVDNPNDEAARAALTDYLKDAAAPKEVLAWLKEWAEIVRLGRSFIQDRMARFAVTWEEPWDCRIENLFKDQDVFAPAHLEKALTQAGGQLGRKLFPRLASEDYWWAIRFSQLLVRETPHQSNLLLRARVYRLEIGPEQYR